MGLHTFDANRVTKLDDPMKFRFVSREEPLLHLGVAPERAVADLGSSTGFFTDEVAPHVNTFYIVNVQAVIHDCYREKGAPNNVEFITADVASPPFGGDHFDAAFSTMTHHELATDEVLAELTRVVRLGGTMVVVD